MILSLKSTNFNKTLQKNRSAFKAWSFLLGELGIGTTSKTDKNYHAFFF